MQIKDVKTTVKLIKVGKMTVEDCIITQLRDIGIRENVVINNDVLDIYLDKSNLGQALTKYVKIKTIFWDAKLLIIWQNGMVETIEEFVNRKVSDNNDETSEKVGILENQIRKIQHELLDIKIKE